MKLDNLIKLVLETMNISKTNLKKLSNANNIQLHPSEHIDPRADRAPHFNEVVR